MSCDLTRLDLTLETSTRIDHCEKHGEFVSHGIRLSQSFDWIWEKCPVCYEDSIELERKQSIGERASKVLLHQSRILGRTKAIPARFKGKTFLDIQTTTKHQVGVKQCCEMYVQNFENYWFSHGKGLTFYGAHGLGKTLHSTVILQSLLPNVVGCYVTMSEFLMLMKASMEVDKDPKEVFRLLSTTPLLVLDEFGATPWPNEQKLVFSLLDTRYRNCLPTILITNLTLVELRNLDPALHSRLNECSIFVPFKGEDFRIHTI